MKRIRIICTIACLLFLASCTSMLDKTPYASVSESTFYKTESDAVEAVNAIYDKLQGFMVYNAFFMHADIWSDDCEKGGGGPGDTPEFQELHIHNIQTSNWMPGSLWSSYYNGVYKANVAIEKISEMDISDAMKTRLVGEAKFLRALFYYNLVIRFGGVPLIENSNQEDMNTLSRSSADEVWKFIETDLLSAISSLPDSYTGADIGRATKGSARGLLGRVYLFTKNWQKAADVYSDIINSKVYRLMDNYADNFLNVGGDNLPESLFEVQFTTGTGDTGNGFQRHGWMRPRDVPGLSWSGNGFCLPTKSLVDAFEPGDVRRKATVMVDGDQVFDHVYSSSWSKTGYNAMKYVYGPGVLHVEADANHKVIRYSEVLLGYAEAIFNGATGKANISGLEALNMVRRRAGLKDAPALTFDIIVNERRCEFALEGHRFFDVVRWGLAPKVFGSSFKVGRDELMPIPVNEILMNPNLKQNPQY
jgi:hypothetical protein